MNRWMVAVLTVGMMASAATAAEPDSSSWRARVPEEVRELRNPVAAGSDAHRAGEKLFEQHCAACHGKNAEGKGRKPSLHRDDIQSATDGELFWLLTNGNVRHGMPSWSRLPDEQRWDIVSFIKRLDRDAAGSKQ